MEDLTREQAEELRVNFQDNLPPSIKAMGAVGVKLCRLPENEPTTLGIKVYMIVNYGDVQDGLERRLRYQVPENLQDNVVVEISSEKMLLASSQ